VNTSIPTLVVVTHGRPLSELGLDRVAIVNSDGTEEPLIGFVVQPGQALEESIRASLKPGQRLISKPAKD
jgi:hypothetical protein